MRNRDEDRLVYSTDQAVPQAQPKVKRPASNAPRKDLPDDGVIRVARERRRASMVTLIHGVGAVTIDEAARELKRRCGGGGNVKDGVILLQGDHRDVVVAYFEAQGRRCKKAGG